MTVRGTYHNMFGQDYSEGRARIDYLVEEAGERRILTIGIGDGGNEIGMGAIAEAVRKHVPHGEILCARVATECFCRSVYRTGAATVPALIVILSR
jgi:hypothetical protein